jgi:hypothetical protein
MGDEATKGFVGPHLVHFLLSPAASEPPPEVAEEDPGLPRRARPPRPARLARARLARASFSTQAAWLIGLRPFSTQSATLGPAEVEVRRAALRCAPLRSAALRSRPVRPARSACGSAARACAFGLFYQAFPAVLCYVEATTFPRTLSHLSRGRAPGLPALSTSQGPAPSPRPEAGTSSRTHVAQVPLYFILPARARRRRA